MNPIELRAAFSLAFVYVLRMLGLFMIMPVLALLAVEFPDYSPLMVGLAIGGYGLTQAVLQIPMGFLSDKVGRKPIIVMGLLLFALGSGVAANADSMMMVVVGRLLQGAGAIAGAIMALAGDVSRDSERSKVMAIIGIAIGFSFYLALLLGPIIAQFWGLQGIFSITAVLAVLCIPLVIWIVPNAQNLTPSGETLPVLQDIKQLITHPQLTRLNISVCILHMLITILFTQLPALLTQQGIALDSHWAVYLPVLLASILGMAVLMRVAKKLGQSKVMQFSALLLSLSFIGFYIFGQSYWGLLIVTGLFFTGFNFLEANFPAWVSSIAPAGKKGSAMGIYASLQFFGAFAGGTVSGVLSQYASVNSIFIGGAILCALWVLLLNGLKEQSIFKRFSLTISKEVDDPSLASQQLAALQGVRDITFVPEQYVAYLKVEPQTFDMQAAKKIAAGI